MSLSYTSPQLQLTLTGSLSDFPRHSNLRYSSSEESATQPRQSNLRHSGEA